MKTFLSTLPFVLFTVVCFTQNGPPRVKEKMLEKMESMRVAYLTNELDLSSEESARFWPVYNEYSKKRMELRKDMMERKRNLRKEDISEEESVKELEEQMAVQEKELNLKRNYYEKFKAILPAQKLAKLEPAEKEFHQEVLRKLKERRDQRMERGMRPMR